MKNKISLKLISILFIFMAISCDKIENPLKENTGKCGSNTSAIPIRKILVEDYTGHTCGNCPRAAEKIVELQKTYCDYIIPIAVHVGFFAYPTSTAPADYRTEAGNELDAFFGNGNAGLPNGLVNRKQFDGNTIQVYQAWTADVDLLLQQTADAKIKIENSFNETSREIKTQITAEMLSDFTEDLNICVYFTEDSIVSPQKDYSLNPPEIPNYTHRHMLRKAVNGAFGTLLSSSPKFGDKIVKDFTFVADTSWNVNHGEIVAFITSTATKEVIQAEAQQVINNP